MAHTCTINSISVNDTELQKTSKLLRHMAFTSVTFLTESHIFTESGDLMEFPYERSAMRGETIPENLSWTDQRMYLALRNLYASVRSGTISRDIGRIEKRKLIVGYRRELEREQFSEKLTNHSSRMWKGIERYTSQYRKNRSLENADALVNAISGYLIGGERID